MSPYILLAPILIYLCGAMIIPRLHPFLREEARTLAVLLVSVLAFLTSLWLLTEGNQHLEWTFLNWASMIELAGTIQLELDTLGGSFLLLSTLLGMIVLMGSLDEQMEVLSHNYQTGLLVMLASLVAFGLANNLMSMLLAGLLLDAGMLTGVGLTGRPRWFLVLVIQSLIAQGILMMATLILWNETGATILSEANRQVLFLVIASAAIRMGILPFSLIPIAFETLPRRVLALLPLSTLGVGSILLGRLALNLNQLPEFSSIAVIGGLAIALGGWVAWWRDELSIRLMMLTAVAGGWVLWAFAWGLPAAALATAWSSTAALTALAIHGARLELRDNAQLPAFVAALMLLGIPSSAQWTVVTRLSGEAWRRDVNRLSDGTNLDIILNSLRQPASWLLVITAIGIMGVMVTLIDWFIVEEKEADSPRKRGASPQPSQAMAVSLLAALSIPFVSQLFGIEVPSLPESTLEASPLAAQLSALVIGAAGGLWLWRIQPTLRSLHPILDTASTFFSFVWLWRFVGRIGWLLLSTLRGMMLVLEGENYGWLLLFLLITVIFLIQ